jgi:sugar-phosphatase
VTLQLECKGLLFDLDGVLVDSRDVVERTWRRWAARQQIDPEPLLRVAHGRRASDTLKEVYPGVAITEAVAWLDAAELDDVEGITAIPGAHRFLTTLPESAWAIVTSCSRALALRRLGAANLPVPRLLVTSDDVARGKPAPDGYRLGATKLGVEPSSCLVFEDAPAGIAAGRAAGCRVVGITTTHVAAQLHDTAGIVADLTQVVVRAGTAGFEVQIGS